MIFTVNLLPGKYGDCIWIEYGESDNTHRILIDGGTGGTKKEINKLLSELPKDRRHFDLIVITHIDRDHIEGILTLLEQSELGFTVDDIWFNGWNHLPENPEMEFFGAKQGERLTAALLKHSLPWNQAFNSKAVMTTEQGALPEIKLAGGLVLTLLSPSKQNLAELKPVWEKELQKEGLLPGFGAEIVIDTVDEQERFGEDMPNLTTLNNSKFEEDEAKANGSSIAFLAEFSDKRALFLGDAQPGQIVKSLKRIQPQGKIRVDLCKISHHASKRNTSPELLELLDCKSFAISTNGSIYYHPHRETIARIIKRSTSSVNLFFNYQTEYNKVWESSSLQSLNSYKTIYGTSGVIIPLIVEPKSG
jgi:beta-lactamase superfamily II metal-dependent hydrolase